MSSLNKVTLIGRLGKDPEIRMLSSDKQCAVFSLATSTFWTDRESGEKKESTEWHNIVVFKDNLVNVCQRFLKKGSKIYLEGMLKTRKWIDNNNNNRYTTEVVLTYSGDIKMLETRNSDNLSIREENTDIVNLSEVTSGSDMDDEIPF